MMRHGLKVLLLLTFYFHVSTADTHSLQYFYTAVTSGTTLPEFTAVGVIDEEQFGYYDSNISKYKPSERIIVHHPDYWSREQTWFKARIKALTQQFDQTTGVHTLQGIYGCVLNDDGTTKGYRQYGYDGEDFISQNVTSGTWTAAKPQAMNTVREWESGEEDRNVWKRNLEKECIKWLKKVLSYSKETLKRKVRPEVKWFQKHSSPSPEVVCHATGFFPKALSITWQKDGEDVHEDVELRETLPNQDGSFQKRSILKVPAEELQKHTYTCVVQHNNLEKELVLCVCKQKGGGSDEGRSHIAAVVAVIVPLFLFALVVIIVLIVLIDPLTLIAFLLVCGFKEWLKEKSGFCKSIYVSQKDNVSF